MSHIPVVDFKHYGLMHASAEAARLNTEAFGCIAQEVFSAFKDVGFVYLKNTGISSDQLQNVFRAGDAFFALHSEVKRKYQATSHTSGWTPFCEERTNFDRPNDLLESYRIYLPDERGWPTEEVPGFKDTMMSFHSNCTELVYRVLDVISYALGFKNPTHLRTFHDMSNGYAPVQMCLIHYPPLTGKEVEPGQIRLAEHTDLGSLTLLFQDETGGLEVQSRDGIYRPATPIPDTVLVNIGDLMQRLTSDTLVSNSHRVVLPGEKQWNQVRRSVAFFLKPSDDCVIKCLDGSDKYSPVVAWEYIHSRMKKLWKLEEKAPE